MLVRRRQEQELGGVRGATSERDEVARVRLPLAVVLDGDARDLMERLLRIASPLGLYAEEFDADTGRHLGNFPQAFSHLALMEAAGRIILPELSADL